MPNFRIVMHATKEKIIQVSIELFNKKGMVNVRLQHIADAAGISVGNLAYHYYSKKAVLIAIDQRLEDEIVPLLAVESDFPSLIDFDNHLSNYYQLINLYSFYFMDVLEMERAYPKIHQKRKDYIAKMISTIGEWLTLSASKGLLQNQLFENQYKDTALTIWMIITFWLTQQKVRGQISKSEGDFKTVIWNQIIPLLSESGYMEYEALILPQLKYYQD